MAIVEGWAIAIAWRGYSANRRSAPSFRVRIGTASRSGCDRKGRLCRPHARNGSLAGAAPGFRSGRPQRMRTQPETSPLSRARPNANRIPVQPTPTARISLICWYFPRPARPSRTVLELRQPTIVERDQAQVYERRPIGSAERPYANVALPKSLLPWASAASPTPDGAPR